MITTLQSLGWNDQLQFLPIVHRIPIDGLEWNVKVAATGGRVIALLSKESARSRGMVSLIVTFEVETPRLEGRLNRFWDAVKAKLAEETCLALKLRFGTQPEGGQCVS